MRLLSCLAATADTIGLAGALLGLLATPVADGTNPKLPAVVQTGTSSHAVTAPPACGPAPALGLVPAALAVLTVDDDGRRWSPARWDVPVVATAVTGPDVTPAALDDIDRVLAWMTATTATVFVRTDQPDAPLRVHLAAGRAPGGALQQTGSRIVGATIGWDPTRPHAARWVWEELLQAAGPTGDHGPAGSLLSTDQTARGPSGFDRWVLHALYQADADELTVARLRHVLQATVPVAEPAAGPTL